MDIVGYKFHYKNGKLKDLTILKKCEINEIQSQIGSNNSDFIFCDNCNCFMHYYDSYLTEHWSCPICKKKVRRQTFYDHLYLPKYSYKETKRKEPNICKICGGPWPQCETSCKMFDD